MPLIAVRKLKVHEEIVAQLESAIASGELKIGERLPSERELMEIFGVGRPAVREAILTLERNGLLRISNGERAVISYPTIEKVLDSISSAVRVAISSKEGVLDFQHARKILEVSLARNAARFATDQHLGALNSALAKNEAALNDLELFALTDVQFHSAIARVSESVVFTGIYAVMSGWLLEQRSVALESVAAAREAYSFHERIFQAIVRHDTDAAEQLMSDHMDAVTSAYWAGVDRNENRLTG